ncbi:MAG TPA: sugar transferase [Sphingomonas sp.]|nr:sugar transferase [Sphingomonas sp.]
MFVKRLIDLALALLGIALFSPIFVGVTLALLIERKGAVFFRQQRPGLHGRPFTLIKFRTMTANPATGAQLPDAARLTRLGRWLRSTSLDELPELWNVLWGDMSIVGPRPLLMQYLDRYSPEQARRHDVRPGLTGYAQIMGRNSLSWEDKLAFDTWYVDHRSLALDLRIIGATMVQVLTRKGINAPGEATMGEFMGTGKTGADRS